MNRGPLIRTNTLDPGDRQELYNIFLLPVVLTPSADDASNKTANSGQNADNLKHFFSSFLFGLKTITIYMENMSDHDWG